MSINGIEINYAASSIPSTKSSNSANTCDSFQKEMVNWEKRVKEALDKEKEYDRSGNIRMSEKKWRTLMKKVDSALDAYKENIKEQEQKEKKQMEEKNMTSKAAVAASPDPDKSNQGVYDASWYALLRKDCLATK